MPSAIVLTDTVTTANDSKVRLVYDGTTTGTKDITVPEVTARMVTDNTTAYNNDTSTFIANTLASGAIIERGSNANGEYVKYADGTLICTYKSIGFNAASFIWTYPHAFSVNPYKGITYSLGSYGAVYYTGGHYLFNSELNPLTQITFYFATAPAVNITLHITVIGRWK